ncbi:MAG: tRNA preQ1(34) S-adenosylmethionine ribosyltransferase-isomerase QueA [Acidobacteriia bacterium]|nr:tRNA preQ1(34) S-adenosylmethionine ribosyltransferase-isomerase QueA [Terriglobia bacterium]
MRVADFDFELPQDLIAQYPLPERDQARMMVVDRTSGQISHRYFHELSAFVSPGDLLVLNNTKVLRARLFGHRLGTTADPRTRKSSISSPIEILLVKEIQPSLWKVLVRPGRKMRVGEIVVFGEGELRGEVVSREEFGLRSIRFECAGDLMQTIQSLGHVPLPPYIRREDVPADAADYQTVYARQIGAVAAPTAGLHFTEALLNRLQSKGVGRCEITLHVGLGTFRPIHVEEVEQHLMHSEWYEIPAVAARKISETRRDGGRIVAVGTTAVRTLEHVARESCGDIPASRGETDLFIYPGFPFKVVSTLITNFHLPRSTLLMLVAAFAGKDLVLKSYRCAIRERYRFFSYGDAMLIL